MLTYHLVHASRNINMMNDRGSEAITSKRYGSSDFQRATLNWSQETQENFNNKKETTSHSFFPHSSGANLIGISAPKPSVSFYESFVEDRYSGGTH